MRPCIEEGYKQLPPPIRLEQTSVVKFRSLRNYLPTVSGNCPIRAKISTMYDNLLC